MSFFFHFLHRKRVIHRKRRKRGFAVTNRLVKRFNLHSRYVYQSMRNFVLYKTKESFFFRISLQFSSYTFFQTVYFLSEFENKTLLFCRSQNSSSFDTNISPVPQKLWGFGSLEVANLKLFRRAIILQTFLKY